MLSGPGASSKDPYSSADYTATSQFNFVDFKALIVGETGVGKV
jgi:hypothetical protein